MFFTSLIIDEVHVKSVLQYHGGIINKELLTNQENLLTRSAFTCSKLIIETL